MENTKDRTVLVDELTVDLILLEALTHSAYIACEQMPTGTDEMERKGAARIIALVKEAALEAEKILVRLAIHRH